MSKFTGYSKIELEMLLDEMKKVLPALLAIAPSFAELTKKNFDELKKQGFDDKQSMHMAVHATVKQIGLGG